MVKKIRTRKIKNGKDTSQKVPSTMVSKEISEIKKQFFETLKELAVVGGFANHVSMVLAGLPSDHFGILRSRVHAKMCAHARSIGAICKSSMFDHSAIMSIARMIIEAMTMYFYLFEKVGNEEWELRNLILELHDNVSRLKLMRVLETEENLTDLKAHRISLVEKIKHNPFFATLISEQQDRLTSGEEIFVKGMRNAATRAAGWHEDTFMAFYNYLSSHTHTAPMSFMRMRSHKIDYYSPNEPQYRIAIFAIMIATACLRRVSLHRLDDEPSSIPKFSSVVLKNFHEQDKNCNIFIINP